MGNLIINIIGVLILMGIGCYLYFKLHPRAFDEMMQKQMRKNAELLKKNDEDMLGKRFTVLRDQNEPVRVNLYMPSAAKGAKVPAVVIAHGGNFMDGSADQIDTFCNRMKDQWESVIISVDYTLLTEKQFPYQHEELRDTVLWFAKHAADFGIDQSKIVMAGFSAGAYLTVGAASILESSGYKPAGVILAYPIVDDTMVRLADGRMHPEHVGIISCGKDQMSERIPVYCQHLAAAGVDYELQTYEDAYPGFIEVNNPEYRDNPKFNRKEFTTEEQENMAISASYWMGRQIDRFCSKQN